jgi:hypothetical protein
LAARSRSRGADDDGKWQADVWLPVYENSVRIMSNHLARSSLFAPIARGPRRTANDAVLVSRRDAVIRYTGEQLDEADADLLMQLMYEARVAPLGRQIKMNKSALLRATGRSSGKSDYLWLERRLRALCDCTLYLAISSADGRLKYSVGASNPFHLLQLVDMDASQKQAVFSLDARWVEIFGNREFIRLNWEKRLQIARGHGLARGLQRLFAASSDPIQRYSVEWLQEKMKYEGRIRDFRAALHRSVLELVRVEVLKCGYIGTSTRGKAQLTVQLQQAG